MVNVRSKCLKLLIVAEVDVNVIRKDGHTPFYYAANESRNNPA